jgi:CRP-like cAMP-binding protein
MPERLEIADLRLPADSEIHALIAACPGVEAYRFADEEYLVRAGEEVDDVYLIVRGSCLVENRSASDEHLPGHQLAVIHGEEHEPAFVGEMAYLGGCFRTASVRSAMNTFALRLKPAHVDQLIEKFPFFTRILCRQFARRLGEVNEHLKYYQSGAVLSVEQRFLTPGEGVCDRNAPAECLFELVDGVLEQEDAQGVREVRPGGGQSRGFLEAAAYLSSGKYESTLRAKQASIVVAISAQSRVNVVRNYPELALRILEERVRDAR